jgi:Bifunctional DNA primase/polymerase, N-terminal
MKLGVIRHNRLQMICELPCFPCSLSKRPLTARGHLAATTSPIDESRWPLTGVPTGATSGLDVLDVDAAGLVWLDQNYSRLPATRAHDTRSGGRHLLFNHAQGLRCSAGRVATGVDVRADGGYVIWWPRAGLRVLSDASVADWPGWLLELARPPSGAPAPFQTALNGLRAPGGVSTTRNLRKRTEHILRLVERAEEGARNNRLFWAACRFGEMVAEGVIRETVAVQLLESAATLCGLVADDGMSRVRATIASGLSVGARALEAAR